VSSVVSISVALRSVSTLPTNRRSCSLSLISKSLSPGHAEVVGPSGHNLAVVAQLNLSEPAKTLSFHAKKSASVLTCSDQRKATVRSSA
jgi:hypothetical protein